MRSFPAPLLPRLLFFLLTLRRVVHAGCGPGTRVYQDGSCLRCPVGTFNTLRDSAYCDLCPLGTVAAANRTSCLPCPAYTTGPSCAACPPSTDCGSRCPSTVPCVDATRRAHLRHTADGCEAPSLLAQGAPRPCALGGLCTFFECGTGFRGRCADRDDDTLRVPAGVFWSGLLLACVLMFAEGTAVLYTCDRRAQMAHHHRC